MPPLPGKTDWTQVDPAFAAWLEEYLRPIGRINAKSEQLLYDAWKAARAHEVTQAAAKPEVERDTLVVNPDEPKAIEGPRACRFCGDPACGEGCQT